MHILKCQLKSVLVVAMDLGYIFPLCTDLYVITSTIKQQKQKNKNKKKIPKPISTMPNPQSFLNQLGLLNGGARLSACTLQLFESSQWQEKGESIGDLRAW